MIQWYYHCAGQKQGPVSDDELRSKIIDGTLSGNALIWEVGTKDWVDLWSHPELGKLIQVPPPLPTLASIGTNSRGIWTGVVDAIPPLGVILSWLAVGVAIYMAQATQHNNQQPNASENWMGALIVGTVLLAVAFVALLRPRKQIGSVSQSWRRLIAKSIDVSIAGIATLLILWVAVAESIVIGADTTILVAWFGAFFVWLVIDWISLDALQTSLGRKLMGIRIEPIDLNNSGFLKRSVAVYC